MENLNFSEDPDCNKKRGYLQNTSENPPKEKPFKMKIVTKIIYVISHNFSKRRRKRDTMPYFVS